MNSYMFKLNWVNVKSAIVYGALAMFITFIMSVAESVVAAHTIFGLDWRMIFDDGVVKSLGIFVVAVSLIKNLLTDDQGKFLGITTVIPDKTD